VLAVDTSLVVLTPEPERLPFDPNGERLRAATQELTRTCGHPVTFVIDAALSAESRGGFETQLIEGIETAARDLAELRKRDPDAFAWGVPILERVACKYKAASNREEAHFDEGNRTLEIAEPAHGWTLVPQSMVRHTLEEAFVEHVAQRYARVSARELPAAERTAYFRFLDETRSMNADSSGEGISEKRGERVLKMFEFEAVVGNSDPPLGKRIHNWLFSHRSYLTEAYVHHTDAAQAAPSGSAFHRAEAAYVEWFKQQLPTMTDEEKLSFAGDVFVRGFNGRGYLRFAYPGFDRLGFALGIVDAWARAGHLTQADSARQNPLHEYIVCPHPVGENGHRSLGPRCDHHMYSYALSADADTKRLVDAIMQKSDPVFTEYAFVEIPYAVRGAEAFGKTLELWRMVEQHEATWRIAARVIAEEMADTADRPRLVDEVRRQWRTHVGRRGQLLYVVARADPYDNDAIDWKDFERDYGSLVGAAEFQTFLDQGPHAMARAHTVWPALSTGWSRAQIIVPRLDAYLSNRFATAPHRAVEDIVKKLCEEGATTDLAQLHVYFASRVRTHPGEAYSDIVDATAPGTCKPPRKTTKPVVRVMGAQQ
jgi:hypothetical protein